jgi:pilus assembly protein CpaF
MPVSLRERLAGARVPSNEAATSAAILDELKKRLHYALIEQMDSSSQSSMYDMRDAGRIEQVLTGMLDAEPTPLSLADRREIIADVIDNMLGYGPIEPFLKDPTVTEVMVNNANTIFVERHGKIEPTDRRFLDETHLMRVIEKIVSQVGRRIDESVPMVDARLPDGSRVNAIIHPLAINGPMLTVRKFSERPFTAHDLVGFGTLTEDSVTFLRLCVSGRLNVLVSGGTGTGKTTLLNVVTAFVPSDERIITIEDSAELSLSQAHVLRLESRPPNIEGKGEVTIRDLVRNSLRMRPDRIIVGEVRGAEALDMLQAMNTGHDGSISTIHANTPRDALSRLETMVLMSGFDLPVRAIREQVASAIDLIIHMARMSDGVRRVTKVSEVEGMEGDVITLNDLYSFDFSKGMDERGGYLGRLESTGLRPKFAERLQERGISLPVDLFRSEAGW